MGGVEPGRDSLEPAVVEPLLRGAWGRPYRFAARCESSQALLGPDDPEGAVAVCDEQTAGRGRLGRSWEVPPRAGVLVSILLRPPSGRAVPELSLVAGVAVALAVEDALGLASQIKWPNDVMVDRHKVAGVLAEARDGHVVLGIGLNVNQERDGLPADASVPAASLFTVDGVRRERAPLLAGLLEHLEAAYGAWRDGGLDALYDDLGPRDFLRNRRVAVGDEEGQAVMIDRSGRLEVTIAGERRLVESGEVRYLR
jgi:BirA family biotin operon repressor/biotin-[acetyl-CoA-carboxylase] ligase